VFFCSKSFIATPIEVLCSNFVKFGRWEIGEIVRTGQKKALNFAWLSSFRYCADCTQNLPGPAPDNVLRMLQNSFTFGAVIAKRVNSTETRRKVNPIFG